MSERTKIFVSCSCSQDGLFVFLFNLGGNERAVHRSRSGDAPEFTAGTSDFFPGREVRTGRLAYRKIGKVTEATSNSDDEKIYFRVIFMWWPSWVCLLCAQVRYGGVASSLDMKPRFMFVYVTLVVL